MPTLHNRRFAGRFIGGRFLGDFLRRWRRSRRSSRCKPVCSIAGRSSLCAALFPLPKRQCGALRGRRRTAMRAIRSRPDWPKRITAAEGWGCFGFELPGATGSYVEMVHPADFDSSSVECVATPPGTLPPVGVSLRHAIVSRAAGEGGDFAIARVGAAFARVADVRYDRRCSARVCRRGLAAHRLRRDGGAVEDQFVGLPAPAGMALGRDHVMSDQLRQRLFTELDRLWLVDPHTHIDPRAPAAKNLADILGYHYYTELAHSAGMPRARIEEPGLEDREKVRRLVSWLTALRQHDPAQLARGNVRRTVWPGDRNDWAGELRSALRSGGRGDGPARLGRRGFAAKPARSGLFDQRLRRPARRF